MDNNEILTVLDSNPQLTQMGIIFPANQLYTESRKIIFERVQEISECIDWLNQNYVGIKSMKNAISTYSIKHTIEKDLGKYISNGELVAAVVALKINHKRSSDIENPNLYLPFSSKQLKSIYKRTTQ